MTFFKSTLVTALAVSYLVSASVLAQAATAKVDVKNAWVRSTVPGQMGTGAFMKITAKAGTQLVGVSSPVAGVGEVHEMKMDGDIMKMRVCRRLICLLARRLNSSQVATTSC